MNIEDFKKLSFGDQIIVNAHDNGDTLGIAGTDWSIDFKINAFVLEVIHDNEEFCFGYRINQYPKIFNFSKKFSDVKALTKDRDFFRKKINNFLTNNWENEYVFRWTDIYSAIEIAESTICNKNVHAIYNCIRCNDNNSWAESNLPNNKFMCFSCRDSNKWLYQEYLSGERS